MDEGEFWVRLEYRVCDEFVGMRTREMRRFWCDGFIPVQYLLEDISPRILGRVWMGIGPRDQVECEFILHLSPPVRSRADVDWAGLLPPAGVTKWITFDIDRKLLVMEPSAAVPDLVLRGTAAPGPTGF
jgi:hypothetical protein